MLLSFTQFDEDLDFDSTHSADSTQFLLQSNFVLEPTRVTTLKRPEHWLPMYDANTRLEETLTPLFSIQKQKPFTSNKVSSCPAGILITHMSADEDVIAINFHDSSDDENNDQELDSQDILKNIEKICEERISYYAKLKKFVIDEKTPKAEIKELLEDTLGTSISTQKLTREGLLELFEHLDDDIKTFKIIKNLIQIEKNTLEEICFNVYQFCNNEIEIRSQLRFHLKKQNKNIQLAISANADEINYFEKIKEFAAPHAARLNDLFEKSTELVKYKKNIGSCEKDFILTNVKLKEEELESVIETYEAIARPLADKPLSDDLFDSIKKLGMLKSEFDFLMQLEFSNEREFFSNQRKVFIIIIKMCEIANEIKSAPEYKAFYAKYNENVRKRNAKKNNANKATIKTSISSKSERDSDNEAGQKKKDENKAIANQAIANQAEHLIDKFNKLTLSNVPGVKDIEPKKIMEFKEGKSAQRKSTSNEESYFVDPFKRRKKSSLTYPEQIAERLSHGNKREIYESFFHTPAPHLVYTFSELTKFVELFGGRVETIKGSRRRIVLPGVFGSVDDLSKKGGVHEPHFAGQEKVKGYIVFLFADAFERAGLHPRNIPKSQRKLSLK